MIASFAAAQDWDGIWLFAYSHSTDWDRQAFSSFFDIDANPAKWGFVPAGAAIIQNPDPGPWRYSCTKSLSRNQDPLADVCRAHLLHGTNIGAAVGLRPFPTDGYGTTVERVFVRLSGSPDASTTRGSATWFCDLIDGNTSSHYLEVRDGALDAHYWIVLGHPWKDQSGSFFSWSNPGFVVLVLSSMDGKPLLESKKVLLTVCGRCENTGMQFTPDRRSVGRNWGKAPVQIEPVEGEVKLDYCLEGRWTCHALKPDGTASEEVPIIRQTEKDGTRRVPHIILSANYGTMWYLLQRQ
jgi:hypothetical protein